MTARKEILAQAKRDKRMTKLARRQKSKAVATKLGIDKKLTSRVNWLGASAFGTGDIRVLERHQV
jgi:hypothetical protein